MVNVMNSAAKGNIVAIGLEYLQMWKVPSNPLQNGLETDSRKKRSQRIPLLGTLNREKTGLGKPLVIREMTSEGNEQTEGVRGNGS